ncbi:hypothetical protein quinque_005538 [Culex quinquefasciatus]
MLRSFEHVRDDLFIGIIVLLGNMVGTKYLLQEIPKINQELAEKLRAGETSVEMLATKAAQTSGGKKPEQQERRACPEIVEKPKA